MVQSDPAGIKSKRRDGVGRGGGGRLLQELEELNQALSEAAGGGSVGALTAERRMGGGRETTAIPPPPPLPQRTEEEDTKKKKKKRSSVWNWKPFRALAHLGQQKLNCLFTVLVHAIEGLPPGMYGMRLAVHFCRKDDEGVCTSPSRVFDGVAEFEESLDLRSSVYGSKNGGAQGGMKYESREFTLSVIAVDVDGLILGKHKLDLTRLLPKNLDDNYERQESWRTSFQLTGKAKGSTLVVTLGYDFLKKDVHNINLASSLRFGASPVLRAARSFNSLPNSGHASPREHQSNSQHVSPALSEPPANSSDYLGMVGMEHLSLDESLTVSPYCLDPSPPIEDHEAKAEDDKVEDNEYSDKDSEETQVTVVAIEVELEEGDEINEKNEATLHNNMKLELEPKEAQENDAEQGDGPQLNIPMLVLDVKEEEKTEESQLEIPMLELEPEEDKEEGEETQLKVATLGSELEDEGIQLKIAPLEPELEKEKGEEEVQLNVSTSEEVGPEEDKEEFEETQHKLSLLELKSEDYKGDEETKLNRFAEFDDEIDRVAGEFLDLLETQAGPVPLILTSDSESDSPRARLLKQFEQEAMLEGGLSLGLDLAETPALYLNEVEDVELTSIMEAAESELQKATQSMLSKSRGKLLEDAETEALMQEWGLNKKVFEGSPPKQPTVSEEYSNDLYALTMAESPALGKDVGPIVHIRDGGSLRSMSPGNFKKNGQLVMQVSKPVVVPGEIGSSSMDILRQMAITGIESMADQTRMVMPLEDITGKTVEEIASEGLLALKGGHHVQYGTAAMATRFDSSMATSSSYNPNRHHGSLAKMSDDTFVSLEDLAPMAMQQIEALALEGLKIQSDMAEEDAPYNVHPLSWEEIAALEDGRGSTGSYVKKIGGVRGAEIGILEGAAASVHLLEGGAQTSVDGESRGTSGGYGLLSMAISLDEWMQLDAGIFDESASILAAHQAAHKDVSVVAQQKDKGGAGANNMRGGFMGDILNLAMLVQLRDPLRNYEPVGAPMMALVQAERVMLPPPQVKVGRWISMKRNNEDVEEDPQAIVPQQPQFKILEVTMSGLKTSDEGLDKKKKLLGWGSHKQQQSGSRWLVANGMNKMVKHPVLQSRAPAPLGASKKIAGQGDSLWSISAKTGSKWKTSTPNSKTRNPDVAFGKSIYGKRK
ncbi:unnamed protein product [Sphagnum troendelagicum]|uniref:C2 NT-type domain-containing protein n=1 Tax=Sphagnum troendelagicum TaxID=128251 RepID=A0ABP0TLD1_9BRYO